VPPNVFPLKFWDNNASRSVILDELFNFKYLMFEPCLCRHSTAFVLGFVADVLRNIVGRVYTIVQTAWRRQRVFWPQKRAMGLFLLHHNKRLRS
jgi:hypothetical protein